jgi:hypothetical protein
LDTIEWNVFNGPPGLSITGRASYLYLGDMGGTATAAGIFDATIQATTQAADGADRVPVTLDVRFRVGSPTYSPWFHDDPLRSAIYFDVRALTVKVVCEPVASDSAPRLVLHNSQTFHVILCDGAKIIEDLPTSVVATVMEPDNFDADALLREVWDTDDHETIGGYDLAFFEFTPGTGDDLDEQFEDLNRSDDAQAASREIPGALRLTVEYDGRTLTSLPAAVVIAQD